MHDFVVDKCILIAESICSIEEYMQSINSPEELKLEKNKIFLDTTMMRLQIIGENIKKITAKNKFFLMKRYRADFIPITRFRDLISHHYERIDSDIVFDICKNSLPLLKHEIIRVINKEKSE